LRDLGTNRYHIRFFQPEAGKSGGEPTCKDVQTLRPNVALDRAHLERMLSLLDLGAVWPPAIRRYKLSEAAEAHRVIEPRHLRGKLVLLVR
jgi:NADPH:quinone reductase-like Zn-dependent oxidoreductase